MDRATDVELHFRAVYLAQIQSAPVYSERFPERSECIDKPERSVSKSAKRNDITGTLSRDLNPLYSSLCSP